MRTGYAWLLAALVSGVAVHSASALTIVLHPDAGLSANAPALAAFQQAANAWQNALTDPITINIDAGLAGTFSNSSIIGQTSSTLVAGGYDTIRNAMVADAADEPSNAIVATLPTAATFTALVPAGRSLSGNVVLTTANARALGFSVSATSDATIQFNSAFSFDYDSSNGVTAGLTDFQTVATHEIGHALGFISAVDQVDSGATSIDLEPLDLFRFSGTTAVTALNFATGPRDLRSGVASSFSDTSVAYSMSTGVLTGDGRQASHWKDDSLTGNYIGIMDPSLAPGVSEAITAADLRAFDLIGYDLVPEPALLGLASLAMLTLRRRF